jgi:succinoglycan biosynthesis protein ExoA
MCHSSHLPYVSIVVPTYNEERYIEQCLCSILAQDYQGCWEVIIVDGESTDRTVAIVASLRERRPSAVRLLDNPQRIIPAALNRGIRAARGEVIVRLDGHTFVEPGYLTSAVANLQNTDAGCIGPRMVMQAAPTWMAQAIAEALSTPFGPGTASFRYSDKEQLVDTANYAIYRRWLFDQIGYFDTNLLTNEDYDFNYRVRAAGHTILYVPALRAYYHTRDTFAALWRQYWRYGYWKITMLKKSPRSLRLRQLVSPLFVLTLTLGCLGTAINHDAAVLPVAILLLYVLAALVFATRQVSRSGRWSLVPGIMWACFLMHVAWGSAFLVGLLKTRWAT